MTPDEEMIIIDGQMIEKWSDVVIVNVARN